MTLSQLIRIVFAFSLLPFLAFAQSSAPQGTVAGLVSNAKTGAALEGAQVTLTTEGQPSVSTISQRDGTFEFTRVPFGTHAVEVSYTGLDTFTAHVDVVGGQTARVLAPLTSEIYKLQAFAVAGVREGNAAAITEQHNAPNIVDVLSTDAYGDVADGNLAIMIQNEPGVDVFQQSGDDTGISVGGVPVELTSVNIDGVRMASAIVGSTGGIGDRGQLIDRIPADFIKEIQITMGNTPDQMADSLAGSVNFVTKSGLDVTDPLFEYRAGVTQNNYFKFTDNRYRGTGALSYLRRLDKAGKFALALNASYDDTLNPSQDINTGHASSIDARATGARVLEDVNERLRDGLNGKIDYRSVDTGIHAWAGATLDYYAFTNDRTNWQASASSQNTADYSVVSLAQIEAGAAPKTTSGAAAGIAPGYDPNQQTLLLDPNVTNDQEHEERRGHQYTLMAGITKEWNDSKLTISASWNPSSFDDDYYGITVNYNAMPIGMFVDESEHALRPVYSQTFGPSLNAGQTTYGAPWTAQWFKQPDIERQTVTDVRSDYEQKYTLAGILNTFKTGLEYRDEGDWFINTYRPFWNFNGNLATAMPQILQSPSSSMSVFNNSMPSYTWDTISFNKANALFLQNPGEWTPVGTTVSTPPPPHDLAEFVAAAYIQDTIQLGHLNILGGVRFEHTSVEGVGAYSNSNQPTVTQSYFNSAYQDFFPSLHLKYDFDRHLVFKASYTTSSARPAYGSIVPNTTVSNLPTTTGQPGSVSIGLPSIKPDYGRNLEGAVEYYINPAGVLSFSYFYRRISDFLISVNSTIGTGPGNGFDGQYAGYLLTEPVNLASATDEGYEINYKQQLTFLPKPFNGISVFANTTQQKTNGVFTGGATQLPFFVPRTSNAGVVYDYAKFEGRFTWHDHSYYLQSYSTTPASNTYVADIPEEDVSFSYHFSPKYTIFLDIVNMRDMDYVQYNINMYTRNTEVQDNGRRINFGVSGRF